MLESKDEVKYITKCRSCGHRELTSLFSLGEQYVSGFVDKINIKSGIKCPIELVICNDCTLVQQRYTAPQDFMYTRHYWYKSGMNQTMRIALNDVVDGALARVDWEDNDIVLDIGANDGTLLSYYPKELFTVGVEPARNLAPECQKIASLTINDFWNYQSFKKAICVWDDTEKALKQAEKAKIVTAIGMLYDLEDPNQFIADVAEVLADDGIFVVQIMCLKQTIRQNDIGNFCHEHLEFYSLASLKRLLTRHGLAIFDVEENDVNGGSYRLFIAHKDNKKSENYFRNPEASKRTISAFRYEEDHCQFNKVQTYKDFFEILEESKSKIVDFVCKERLKGKTFWVYGASTKGNVILQYYGLCDHLIWAAADKSPEKWGLYTVGSGIPIKPENDFRKDNPDYALILPYAFTKEFINREREWLNQGGHFIVPFPTPRLVNQKTMKGENLGGGTFEIEGSILETPL